MSGIRATVLALLVGAVGCGDNFADPEPREPENGTRPLDSDELYADDAVIEIEIVLSEEAIARLDAAPRTYVVADVRIGDRELRNVGVRLKGRFSFQTLSGKPSFKIKVSEFIPNQRFLGLERLTLNNMRQDRSQIHEWLAYRVFRAVGLPAPRSAFARVIVNGVPYGLYANVESPDTHFLRDHYGDATGNLYEAPWTADLDAENVVKFEQDAGEDKTRADLDLLVDQLADDSVSAFFGPDALIDADQFLRFVATEAAVSHWDGYWKSNNYFIYHELDSNKWTWLPWGLDQSWDRVFNPWSSEGVAFKACMRSPECMLAYADAAAAVLDAIARLDLDAEIEAITAMIDAEIRDDPRAEHPPEKTARFQRIAARNLAGLESRMRPRLGCLDDDGREADRDGDGFGACIADCDDASAQSNPFAPEVCDGRDNDCDGQVDEVLCACEERIVATRRLLFCPATVSWSLASFECEQRGGILAPLEDLQLSAAAFETAAAIASGTSWFIGAHDRLTEGEWLVGEQPRLDLPFAPGEPDDFGGQDCAVLASFADGGWADASCTTPLPYICEIPRDEVLP